LSSIQPTVLKLLKLVVYGKGCHVLRLGPSQTVQWFDILTPCCDLENGMRHIV